jgi:peptide deformylase
MRIVKYPHPTLRHKSKPLRRVDAELRKIVAEMFELMYVHKGIGLSANQVDLPYRLFITNVQSDPAAKDQELVFINPDISRFGGGTAEADEGCLSFPGIYAPVRRAEKIRVSAYNLAGEEVHYEAADLLARAIQHEYDHLDGVLFIDRLTPGNLAAIRPELAELELEFSGQRQRGAIPDDQKITARLVELEGLRA